MRIKQISPSLGLAWLLIAGFGCEERTAAPPPKPVAAPPADPFQIRQASREETTAQSVLDELRIKVFAYEFQAPLNHRVSFWREVWRDGILDQSLSDGLYIEPGREKPTSGQFFFSFMDGQSMNSAKSRWSTRLETYQEPRIPGSPPKPGGSSGRFHWVEDPLKAAGITLQGSATPSIDKPVQRGRTYTLQTIGASRGEPVGFTEGVEPAVLAKTIPVLIVLRARIERVPSDQLREGGTFGTTDIPPTPLKD